ncbi:hypothetical protein [Marinobacter salarius]|uniref:hypothetical protein n=1 Tax=Marinobacter salarius TaxID=1420917 RepID=UPI003D12B6AD
MLTHVNPDFWWALGFAVAIAAGAAARKRFRAPDGFKQMDWMDWCGHFALIGIGMVLFFGLLGFDVLRNAGMFLVLSLFPIAILGLLGRFDGALSELIRAIRRR